MIRMTYSHGRMYVWRRNGEMLSYKCTHRTVKGAGQGVMVWGCMAASSVGRLVMLEGKVNSAVYLKLMQEVIIPEGRRIIGDDFILQQDNAPIHKAKIITKYLAEAGVNVMTWPPQSPDLSPIENLWAMLKIKIAEQKPNSLKDLRAIITETWPLFTQAECQKLVHSLPQRLGEMSRRNGGNSRY
ncbi:hypothetical protein DMENIID0001_071700 [Sergentomyia squamirostris]